MKKSPSTISSGITTKGTFAKTQDAKVVGTADDYESDRVTEQERVEQILQDLDDSFSKMEVQTPQQSPVLASTSDSDTTGLSLHTHIHLPQQPTSSPQTQQNPQVNLSVPQLSVLSSVHIPGLTPPQALNLDHPHQSTTPHLPQGHPHSTQQHPLIQSVPSSLPQNIGTSQPLQASIQQHPLVQPSSVPPSLPQNTCVSQHLQAYPQLPPQPPAISQPSPFNPILSKPKLTYQPPLGFPRSTLKHQRVLQTSSQSPTSLQNKWPLQNSLNTSTLQQDGVQCSMNTQLNTPSLVTDSTGKHHPQFGNLLPPFSNHDMGQSQISFVLSSGYQNTVPGFGLRQTGTTINFVPPLGQDTEVMNGVTQNVSTSHNCITAMREYENKSLEELRVEDYMANRKFGKASRNVFSIDTIPTVTPASTGFIFGQNKAVGFGTSNSGVRQLQQQTGTTVKFVPVAGQDTMVKNGVTQNINTSHQCISAMKEYENMSLEELRVEDYLANRKVSSSKLFCDKCRTMHDDKDIGQCCDGHLLCKTCLEAVARVIKVGKIGCPVPQCNSIIPKSQVKKILPDIIPELPDEKWENGWIINGEAKTSEAAGSKGYESVKLDESDHEFERVSQLFSYSMQRNKHSYSVRRVYRIQNQRLWEKYMLTRTHMIEDLGEMHINERRLFHGSSYDVFPAICEEGFDWRLCGKNATAYGKGAYFARDATYSHDYSTKTEHRLALGSEHFVNPGVYLMFVVKVLVGRVFKGEKTTTRPPRDKTEGKKKPLHSAVNSTSDPAIFVIFDISQSYPEYVIEYIRNS